MIYLSCVAYYEGSSDRAYFATLIPRVSDDMVLRHGGTAMVPDTPAFEIKSREFDGAAAEVCKNRDAFELLFVHADTGGRGVERSLPDRSASLCAMAHMISAIGLRSDACSSCRVRRWKRGPSPTPRQSARRSDCLGA